MLALAARMNLEGDLVLRAAGSLPADRRPRAPFNLRLAHVTGGSGWTSAAAATSEPLRSSRAALRKASHAMASAPATSVAATVSATVTRT